MSEKKVELNKRENCTNSTNTKVPKNHIREKGNKGKNIFKKYLNQKLGFPIHPNLFFSSDFFQKNRIDYSILVNVRTNFNHKELQIDR